MSTMQHTPGPWQLGYFRMDGYNYTKIDAVVDGHKKYIASVDITNDRANAHLIAAAPELLEALEGLLTDITEYQQINNLGGENNHWQVIARTAIAKAKGEQP